MSSRPEGIVFIDLHATANTQDRPARYGATAFPERAEIVQLSGTSKMQILFTSRVVARSSKGFRCCPCWEDVFLGNFRCWPCWEDDFLFLCLQIDILLVGKTIFVSLFSSSHAIQYLLLLVHFF